MEQKNRIAKLNKLIADQDGSWKTQAVENFKNEDISKDFKEQFRSENAGKEPTIDDYERHLMKQQAIEYHAEANPTICKTYTDELTENELKMLCYRQERAKQYKENPDLAPRTQVRDPVTGKMIDNPYYVTYEPYIDTPDCKAEDLAKTCELKKQETVEKVVKELGVPEDKQKAWDDKYWFTRPFSSKPEPELIEKIKTEAKYDFSKYGASILMRTTRTKMRPVSGQS